MSFYGTSMIFDGVSCEEMGLVMYDFTSNRQSATTFSSDLEIAEDRIGGRYRSLFYGGAVNAPLTFTMVLCASEDRAERNEPLDRWDLQKIASWLTGHREYKWLSIVQEDMEEIRYRCLISSLQAVEVAGNKWGVSFQVTCDSPYAYLRPMVYDYTVVSSLTTTLRSESSHNGFYYPKLAITGHTGGDLSIRIENRMEASSFTFQGLPSAMGDLTIDCENGVITSASGLNPYQYLSYDTPFHFPRFARGDNTMTMTGSGRYTFTCEWPVNVGG